MGVDCEVEKVNSQVPKLKFTTGSHVEVGPRSALVNAQCFPVDFISCTSHDQTYTRYVIRRNTDAAVR